jgi:branched-chain amino acid transport system substrate-binding protein
MEEITEQVLKELIEDYGVGILEDPDRLSQFLEDRCPTNRAANFRLTFALRYLVKSGWTPHVKFTDRNDNSYAGRLCEHLGFTAEDAEDVIATLRSVVKEHDSNLDAEGSMVIAKPGNLRTMPGGISNKPRTMWIRKKSFYNGLVLIASLIVIAVLFFQIGSQRNPVGDEFRIAMFAPMSGAAAQSSHNQLRAAQLAVELINKQGGIRGYKLKIIGYDLPLNEQAAAESVRKVMQDKSILAMMTGVGGKIAEIMAQIADETNVPLVITASDISADSLIKDDKPYLYTFYIANDTDSRAKMLAYFAIQGLGKKKIGLFYDSDDNTSTGIHESALRWIKIFGGKVTADISGSWKNGTSSNKLAIQAIAESGADLLLLPGRNANTAAIAAQSRASGFNKTILAEDYTTDLTEGDGSLSESWWINEVSELDPQIRSVLKEYVNLYNEGCPPKDIDSAVLAYDGVGWIANALFQAPGYRGEAIRHALLATRNFPMTHATLTIDPRTHGPLNKAMAIIHCANGKGIFQRRISIKKSDNVE